MVIEETSLSSHWVTRWRLKARILEPPKSESLSHSVMSTSLGPHGLQPTRFLCPWNSPGKNMGVGSCSLLQGIFPTQGSNPGLPHCRRVLYQLSHKETQKYWSGHYPKVLLFQILNQGLGNLAITYSLGRFQSSL